MLGALFSRRSRTTRVVQEIHMAQFYKAEFQHSNTVVDWVALRWHVNPGFSRSTNLESKLIDFFAFLIC